MTELQSKSVKPGDVIFRFGEPADCAYLVEKGEVSMMSPAGTHKETIASVTKGGLFGEMGIIDNTTRSATAIAKTYCVLSIIDREQLHTRLNSADPVLQLIMTILLDRLRQMLHPRLHTKSTIIFQNIGIDYIKLENELKTGINNKEMRLFLQPIVDIHTKEIAGFECFIRWQHPDRGLIRPDIFIQLAEDSGLMLKLGRWILQEAFRLAQCLENTPNKAGVYQKSAFISINVSTAQFNDPHFFSYLEEAISTSGIHPKRIKLEITESSLTDMAAAKHWIIKAKSLGVKVALDDFGTGYSSLSYLHEFDLDTIKIDQSFIWKMLSNERSMSIVESIIQLAAKLNLEIIAEGIESQEHIDILKKLGCHYLQGYIISKPMEIDHFL